MIDHELYTVTEIAKRFRITEQTVRRRAKWLGLHPIGREYRLTDKQAQTIWSQYKRPRPKIREFQSQGSALCVS